MIMVAHAIKVYRTAIQSESRELRACGVEPGCGRGVYGVATCVAISHAASGEKSNAKM
jgi:hypothetical protein